MTPTEELKEFYSKVNSNLATRNDTRVQSIPEVAKTEPPSLLPGRQDDACLYIKQPGGKYFPSPLMETTKSIPSQCYTIKTNNDGIFLESFASNTDELLRLYDSDCDEIIEQINTFWEKEEHYRKHNFLWKRGFLLWGPPGSGKTCAVQIVCSKVIEQGCLVFYINNCFLASTTLKIIRNIEPKRPIVAIFEDLDAIVNVEGEIGVLSLLDGENQIDNIVFIATTNYPERLDPRIINRPSRFDIIKKIGMPNTKAREAYLSCKSSFLKNNSRLLSKYSKDTEGFSFAHIKELIVATEVFEIDYDESLDRLKSMIDTSPSSKDYNKPQFHGFGKQTCEAILK